MNIQQASSEHRIGQFNITMGCIDDHPEVAMLILSGCLPTRAVPNGSAGIVTYTAICADFDPHSPGADIPQYTALVAPDVDGLPPVRSWRRVSP